MTHFQFFASQFTLFSILFVFNIVMDDFISKPFTYVDVIAIVIGIPVIIIIFSLVSKTYKKFKSLKFRVKVILSIPAFVLSIMFVGFLWQMVYI